MNEKKKSIVAIVIVIAVLAFFVIIQAVASNSNHNTTSKGNYSTSYEEAFKKEGKQVLMIGRAGCGWCQKFQPHINYLSSTYEFSYYYVDTDKLVTGELQSLLERLGVDTATFGTPYVAILENGQKIEEIGGYVEEESLFKTLQSTGIISTDENYVASGNEENEEESDKGQSANEDDSQYTSLSFPDYSTFKATYDKGDKMVVVLGQTGCGYCTNYKPIINEIAKENKITIHYVNLTKYSSDDVGNLLNDLASYFDGVESWGTPLTLIVEDQKVVASQKGSASKEATTEFLKENKVIK